MCGFIGTLMVALILHDRLFFLEGCTVFLVIEPFCTTKTEIMFQTNLYQALIELSSIGGGSAKFDLRTNLTEPLPLYSQWWLILRKCMHIKIWYLYTEDFIFRVFN